jgi:hypothetical protein
MPSVIPAKRAMTSGVEPDDANFCDFEAKISDFMHF